eukprot:1909546-Rhodomonas_salina.3
MSGTELAYGATRCPLSADAYGATRTRQASWMRGGMCDPLSAYAYGAIRCPRMVYVPTRMLRGVGY